MQSINGPDKRSKSSQLGMTLPCSMQHRIGLRVRMHFIDVQRSFQMEASMQPRA